jgi:two-component system OmpR family response regulator
MRDGHHVELARTVQDAIDLARNTSFDVFLLDILLPDGSGLDLARQLRQAYPAARLIATTALGMPEDRIAIAEAGFDAHLLKPYRLEQLRSQLAAAAAEMPVNALSASSAQ